MEIHAQYRSCVECALKRPRDGHAHMYVPDLLRHMSRTDYAVQNTGVNYKTAKKYDPTLLFDFERVF